MSSSTAPASAWASWDPNGSLEGLNGWSTFGEAWQGALPLVAAQFDEGGQDFAAKVRKKAARRIGVTVLDGTVEDVA